jgi:DNA-binding MarR family transcriptional regulator
MLRVAAMNVKDKLALTYARFLHLAWAIEKLPDPVLLNPAEERMLQCLTVAWSAADKITVLEAMGLKHGLSQSTAHRRLTSLRKKGLLVLKQHDKDARVRFVMQTERTEQYLAHMGRCVIEASKAAA